jgi:hypothetical protein
VNHTALYQICVSDAVKICVLLGSETVQYCAWLAAFPSGL